jgi:outer membrane protein
VSKGSVKVTQSQFYQSGEAEYIMSSKSNATTARFFLILCLVFAFLLTAGIFQVKPGHADTVPEDPAEVSAPSSNTSPGKKVITLEDSIEMAVENHPELKAALALKRSADARLTMARSAYYPGVGMRSSYNRSGSGNLPNVDINDGNLITPSQGNSSNLYNTSLYVSQNIYDFGRTKYRVMSARENLNASHYDVLSKADRIIFDIEQAYFRAVAAEKAVEVNQEAVEQQQMHLKQAQDFYKIGRRAKIEVTKAEVDLANARQNLLIADNRSKLTKVNLAHAIGVTGSFDYALDDTARKMEIEMDFDTAVNYARNHRPEVLRLQALENQRKAHVGMAKSEQYPTVTGSASYGWRDQNLNLNNNNWGVGMQVNFDIFSGGRKRAEIDDAFNSLEAVQQQNQRTWQVIYLEIQQAFLELNQAENLIEALEKSLENARENFRLAKGRYEVGLSSNLEFTDAQQALNKAQLDYISAVYDYQVARARVEQATGLSVINRNLAERFFELQENR